VQLNGKMNIVEKGKAIDTFTNDPDCRIFLMSLKAGGVALNLTVASHVSSVQRPHLLYLYTAISSELPDPDKGGNRTGAYC
jgi:hypothetical protein